MQGDYRTSIKGTLFFTTPTTIPVVNTTNNDRAASERAAADTDGAQTAKPPVGLVRSPESSRLARYRWIRTPLFVFIVTRLAITAIAYVAVSVIPDAANTVYHLRGTDNRFLDVFGSRWDTGFYIDIAEHGYTFEGVELPSVAFFPLFPMLMRILGPLFGDVMVAGLLISHLALLLATILLYRLAYQEWGEQVAARTIWYFSIFPASVFGSAVYTESLFLATAIGAALMARRGLWVGAGLLGIAASLTRLTGVLVAVLLVGEWWRQRRGEPAKRPSLWALLAAALTPLGTVSFMAYCWQTFGTPFAWASAASAWGRVPQSPFVTIAGLLEMPEGGWVAGLFAGRIHVDNWIDLAAVLLFLVLGCALLADRRWGEGLYVVLGVTMSFGSGLLMSQRRYMWVLFPAFVLLARWGDRRWVDRTVTLFSLMALALFTALFANGYWVG